MQDKCVLICGARNKWSIAWHCAQSMHREGARVAFSVFSEREKGDVEKLLDSSNMTGCPIFTCNATDTDQVAEMFENVGKAFDGKLDGLLHGIAFAKREDLSGQYITTSLEGFNVAMDNSVFSLVALTAGAQELLKASGSGAVVTLTYMGSEKVMQGYNVMGVAKAALEASVRYLAADLGPYNIRVNAVSAGPIKTLAASGIQGFSSIFGIVAERSPLRRGVDADEVGDTAAFLLSDMARGITGEILYVDAGYNIMGI